MLHIEDGFAVIIEEENTTAPSTFYDFSHLTEGEPLPFEPKTDKKNNLLLF